MIFGREFVTAHTRKLLVAVTALAGAALVGVASAPVQAQTYTWGGTGSNTSTSDYNFQNNWSNTSAGRPPLNAGQSAIFDAIGSSTVTVTGGPITPDSWTFTAAAQSYTISGVGVNFNGAGPNLVNNANAGQSISISMNMTGAAISQAGASTLTLSGTNAFTTTSVTAGTLVNSGSLTSTVTNSATYTNNSTQNGDLTNSGTFSNTGTVNGSESQSAGGTTNSGTITGTLGLTGGTFTNNAGGQVQGTTTNNGGTVTNNGGTFAAVTNATGTFNNSTGNAGAISNAATATNGGTVTGLLANSGGTFSNTGAMNGGIVVSGGTVSNNGTVTGGASVATGGTLRGVGTTQNLTVNGGTFAPGSGTAGTSMTVTGSLVMQAAATYLVQVNPTTASFASVTGAATLNGATVSANFAAGSYVVRRYTILTATGGVNGAFGGVTGQPANMTSSLSYDTNNAYLDLKLGFSLPGGTLNQNQQNVGNALTDFFNRTGGIPAVFAALSAGQLGQSAGEAATGSQQSTFNAMNQFMGVMTDPFVAGRGDPVSVGGSASGYADEQGLAYAAKRNPNDALAAIYRKAPVADPFTQRWSVWAAGFGGSQTTSGNAVQGTNNTSSNLYGTAVGADYRISPNTLAGFALAGGGTNFSVANGLGSGRSDLFQAGAFVRHTMGAAYLSGALAYGWQDITTNRTLTIAGIDQLRAQFNANAWSGRIEGGYRLVSQGIGWTPYAAGQFTTFDLPAYAEQVVSGANTFALAYAARRVTATRSELGLRTDKSFAMADGVFTLRGRAAWAHDYDPDRTIGATFQTLPGASFVVNGARLASDAALVTASAEKKWLNGWSAAATFEGEFSNVTTSYAGKGVVRYAW